MNNERPIISYPPRKIPFDLSIMLILGNFMAKLGFFFFGFGLIFVWIFGINADYTSWYKFRSGIDEVPGMIKKCEKTGFSEGRGSSSSSQGSPVYKYSYSYTDKNGLGHEGISYSTKNYNRVSIQYLKNNPDYSRIKGALRKPMPPLVGFVFIFPIIGIFMTIKGIKKGMISYFLLKHGYPAEAKIVERNSTSQRINNHEVINYELEFSIKNGTKYRSSFKTHLTDNLDDEDTELIFYDPYKPEVAIPFDALTTKPLINTEGRFLSVNKLKALWIIILYIVVIIGHGLYIIYRFL